MAVIEIIATFCEEREDARAQRRQVPEAEQQHVPDRRVRERGVLRLPRPARQDHREGGETG